MKREILTVRPVTGGWTLETQLAERLMFLSGADAERTARSLAHRLATHGLDTTVCVTDRSGAMVAQINYYSLDVRPGDDANSPGRLEQMAS